MGGWAPEFGLAVILTLVFSGVSGQGTTNPPRLRRHFGAAQCSYAVSPGSRSHAAGFQSGTVTVTAPAGCAWTAASNDAWITITDGSIGTGNGTVKYSVAVNTCPPRSGKITIAGQPFTIDQAAEEITIYLGPNSTVPLVLVRIPAGTFTMGSPDIERGLIGIEVPQHEVTLTRDYYLGKTEVTQRQWAAVMGSNPNANRPYGVGDDYPVSLVRWRDVCGGTTGETCGRGTFIGNVNQLLGATKFRLPTEAEWERAARGGTQTPFSFGDDESCSVLNCSPCDLFAQYMWWCGNAGGTSHPVAQKMPNPYGLYDMHGNVFEFVADWGANYTSGAQVDPIGPPSGYPFPLHVIRSGSWEFMYANACRSAARGIDDGPQPSLGFRLAMSL